MKKRKLLKTPNAQLLPSKKKEMLKIMNDPNKLKEVMNFIQASSNLFEKSKTVKATTILDWVERCILILPDDLEDRDSFIQAFRNFTDTYGETKDAITNERKDSDNERTC